MHLKIERTVSNGNSLSINGKHYIPVINNKRYTMEDNAKLHVLSNDKYPMYIKHNNKKIHMKKIEFEK